MRRSLLVASSLALVLVTSGSQCPPSGPLAPASGAPEYQALALAPVPGGLVNVAGGNLLVRRLDLSIDTRLGTHEVAAVYDGVSGAWHWSFDVRYDGAIFVDESAARHALGSLADGAPVPGTVWTRVDAVRVATRGGLVHRFDPNTHRLLSIHRSASPLPELRFVQEPDGQGGFRTDRVDQCSAGGCALVYDVSYAGPGRRPASVVDRAGRRAEFAWDAAGRLAAARDGLDVARRWAGRRYAYDGARLVAQTSSEGERIEYGWAQAGAGGPFRVASVRQVGAGDPTWRLTCFGPSQGVYRSEFADPLGHTSVWKYDSQRRVLELRNGAGEATAIEWSGRRPTRWVEPGGAETRLAWADDALATATLPTGLVVRFTPEPGGENRENPLAPALRRIEDDLGPIETRGYDAAGRLVSIANGAGETTRLAYDADEAVASITDPAGVVTAFADYGEHGHAARATHGGAEVELAYDAVGNLVQGPDLAGEAAPGRGGVRARRFDEDRNVRALDLVDLSTWAALAEETLVVERRSDGQPLRVLRPGGGDTEWSYDALGRAVERRERADGQWRTTRWTRDALGRVTALDRPNGMGERWSYDAAGRAISHRILRDGALESSAGYAFADGRLAWRLDSAQGGVESYAYDAAGRAREIRFAGGERLELGRDARGRVVQALLWTAEGALLRGLGLAYDAAGRERRILDGGVVQIERSYEAGRLARTRYGNGLERRFAYDAARGALVGSTTTDAAGLVVESTVVEPFGPQCGLAAACVLATTRTFGALPATSEEGYWLMPATLPFDPRTHSGKRVGSALAGGLPATFDYDALGNLLAGSAGALVYNAERNRLGRITGGPDYAWDAAGFAVRRGGTTLEWDGAGRIAAVGDARFRWDAEGRLVESEVPGAARRHLFGGLVAADAATGTPLAIELGELRVDLATGAAIYRHFDFRGNAKLVSDAAGRVVAHYRYGAYGVDAVFGSDADPVRFARGRALGELALVGHRVYDAAAARFLAPDPVEQLVNAYAYAAGNPVQLWDPDGRASIAIHVAVAGAALGGGVLGGIAGAAVGEAIAGPPGALLGGWIGARVYSQAASLLVFQALTGQRGGGFRLLPAISSEGALPGGGLGASPPALSAADDFSKHAPSPAAAGGCGGDACPSASGGAPGRPEDPLGSPGGGGYGCAPVEPIVAPDRTTLGILFAANCAAGLLAWLVVRRAKR